MVVAIAIAIRPSLRSLQVCMQKPLHVLILGGTGWVGSNIAKTAVAAGFKVGNVLWLRSPLWLAPLFSHQRWLCDE